MIHLEWLIHSKSDGYKNRVSQSKRIIDRANRTGAFAIAWSGGKDSTAMCHLIKSISPDTPIIVQFDDCDWPDKKPYIDRICNHFSWKIYPVYPGFSVWEKMQGYKIGGTNFCSQCHPVTKEAFLAPMAAKRQELGCDGFFIGLRKEESRARQLNSTRRGQLYKTKNGEWKCNPIDNWKVADVFAYHVANGIEINPCYLSNKVLKPEEVRLSWAVPTPTGMGHGEMENIRRNYPEQYRRLREKGVKT